ncbi:MAG: Ig-like domain-containing protein [Ruminococcus sp.]|nr:Ig-like domain-containing protein [Ruminococcus sp.]MDD6709450.1 Ig-like domain-containing protein [Ruminococcus sp.]
MKKLLSITSLCLALLMISFSTVFAVDNSTPSNSDKSQNANPTINNTRVVVNTEPTKVDTPKELQELYPNTNFTVTKLGEVGEYSLYYNVTQYYQFLDYNVTIGEYIFNCFAQQKPYDLGLYVVGNSKAYTLADAYKELKIDMDTVYSLITSKYINYNFTVGKSIPDVTTQPSENHNVYYYLKGATSSNNETTVGNHYNTVIKPNSPYEIDYVVVTVNNKEKEVTKNSDGSYTIDLDNVDGDINIFASATREKVTEFSTARVGWYVNYNLSNVESSNTTDDVWLNYKTTLTPKDGYAITYVSATVNGKDVGKITKNNGIYTIDIEKVTGNLTITAEAKNVVTDTPKEIQKLSPKTNFTVANLGKVGNYNLYYNVTQYYQFFENIIKIGNYEFDCFAQQSPYGLGLYVVGNGKAYTLKDAYDKLNINMDAVYSLINKTNLHYNFTVVKIAQEKLSATNVSLKSGATKTIKVLNGKVKSYKVVNSKVAKVNSKGVVTALNKGKTTVIVTLKDGNKLNCKVNVTTAPKLSKSTVNVKVGKTVKVKALGKAKNIALKWTVSNKNVDTSIAKMISASVLNIKGVKKGKTTLKVKVNNVKTLTLKVNVK